MKVWLFIKKKENEIGIIKLYGSVRSMFKGEKIKIKRKLKRFKGGESETYEENKPITEYVLRALLIKHNDKYVDENYHIEKIDINRSKHQK